MSNLILVYDYKGVKLFEDTSKTGKLTEYCFTISESQYEQVQPNGAETVISELKSAISIIFQIANPNIKTRKSNLKKTITFYFGTYNSDEQEAIVNFEKVIDVLDTLQGQGQTSTNTKTTTFPYEIGTEFVTNVAGSNKEQSYIITNLEDGEVFVSWYSVKNEESTTDFNYVSQDTFVRYVKEGTVTILPASTYSMGEYLYNEEGDLCVFVEQTNGFELRSVNGSKYYNYANYTPKLISHLLSTGYWKNLTVENGDMFSARRLFAANPSLVNRKFLITLKNPDGTYSASVIDIFSNDKEDTYLTSYLTLEELWRRNAEKIVDAVKIIEAATQINNLSQLEQNILDLKSELTNLVELRSQIRDIDFEDKVNVNTMITEVQKKIDYANAKLLEEKIGSPNFFDSLFEQSFTPLKNNYDSVITKNNNENLIAPNGQLSDLNEKLQTIVNSNDFIEWFGDWRNAYFYRNLESFGGENVSKALSDKFEPLLVYHGTGDEFSYFKFDRFPANYFAVNRAYSEFFARIHAEDGVGYVLPFFINVKNPLDLTIFDYQSVEPQSFFDWLYLQTGMTPEELEVQPIFLEKTMRPIPVWMYLRNNPQMLVNIAQKTGFDSIYFDEYNPNIEDVNSPAYSTRAYIIFDPHQVKLADPDRGDILLTELKSFILKRGGKI